MQHQQCYVQYLVHTMPAIGGQGMLLRTGVGPLGFDTEIGSQTCLKHVRTLPSARTSTHIRRTMPTPAHARPPRTDHDHTRPLRARHDLHSRPP